MKITNKIALTFIVFSSVLALCAASVVYLVAKEKLHRLIYAELERDVDAGARHVETYLELLKVSINQFTKSIILENLLKSSAKDALSRKEAFEVATLRLCRTKEANPEIDEFLVLDTAGKVIASSNPQSLGQDESTDAFFIGGQTGIFIKDAYYSQEAQKPLLAVAGPIFDRKTKELLGVLAARVRLHKLDRIAAGVYGNTQTRESYIVNKYGYMITASRFLDNTFLKQKIVSQNFRFALLHRDFPTFHFLLQEQPLIFRDYRGQMVIGAHRYLPEMQWVILAEIDDSEALAPLRAVRLAFLIILLLIPLAAYFLGRYLALVITQPIHRLQEITEAVSRGDFSQQLKMAGKDEIGQLAAAFNVMTKNLRHTTISVAKLQQEIALRQRAQEEISRSEERYRKIFTESRDAMVIISPVDGKIVAGNPAAVKLFNSRDENELCMMRIADLSPECQPDGTRSTDLSQQMFLLAIARNAYKFEWVHRSLNGKDFSAEVFLSKFEIEGKVLLQATVREIENG